MVAALCRSSQPPLSSLRGIVVAWRRGQVENLAVKARLTAGMGIPFDRDGAEPDVHFRDAMESGINALLTWTQASNVGTQISKLTLGSSFV
jgi:hypothetical protein